MDSPKKSQISPERRFVGRKDKERLKELKRMHLEQQRLKRLKEDAEMQLRRLKGTGLVNAYQSFLRSLCVDGLPEPSILYQRAAQYVLHYEKKMKLKMEKKQIFQTYSSQVLKKSRSKSVSPQEKQINLPKLKKEKKR